MQEDSQGHCCIVLTGCHNLIMKVIPTWAYNKLQAMIFRIPILLLCLLYDWCLFGQSERLQVLHQRFYSSVSAARGPMLSLSVVHTQPRLNVKILVQNFSGSLTRGDILPCTPLWLHVCRTRLNFLKSRMHESYKGVCLFLNEMLITDFEIKSFSEEDHLMETLSRSH